MAVVALALGGGLIYGLGLGSTNDDGPGPTVVSAVASAEVPADVSKRSQQLESSQLYSSDSPFNTAIPEDAAVDARSDELVQSLVDAQAENGFVFSIRRFTVPAYEADATTERFDVAITAPWTSFSVLSDVPIPDGARPDPADDGHLTVIDREQGCSFDFWQARQAADGSWSASWVNSTSLAGDGIYDDGRGARASGFANLAGLVWPHEIESGQIDHALVFVSPHVAEGGPVAPATASDGTAARADAIPTGARVQLDPSLDLETLNLSSQEEVLARAMQEYGMILGDSGGALSVFGLHPFGFESDPWAGIWPEASYGSLNAIPADAFRVLELGEQSEDLAPVQEPACGERA